MFKAKDIMTRKVVCVRPKMPIYEALRSLTRSNLSSVPVVDENLHLLGVISEKNVLQLLYDTDDNPDLKVLEFMNTDVISFEADASLIDLCDCLLKNPFRRIPITKNGVLEGIVCQRDVIEAILKIKHQQNTNP